MSVMPSEDAIAQEMVAKLAAQPDGGDALLRVLLRADPDRAVRVVDGARVARAWASGEGCARFPLTSDNNCAAEVIWMMPYDPTWEMYDENSDVADFGVGATVDACMKAADAALRENGWVLAGGSP